MKKLLLISFALVALNVGGSAFAADMGVTAPLPPPPPVFSWTGLYIGIQGGGGWGLHENSVACPETCSPGQPCITIQGTPGVQIDSHGISGVFLGGTVGFNAQAAIVFGNPVVVGIEGDGSWADINGKGTCNNSFAPF